MPGLHTDIEIDAPRAVVWDALVHKEDWYCWNTFLFDQAPERPFRQGHTVTLALKRLEQDEATIFTPLVTQLQPQTCLRWVAKIPGLRSEHVFQLQDIGPQRTQYSHQERLSGPLSRLFLPFIRQDERHGLRRMARQLKRYAEYNYDGYP